MRRKDALDIFILLARRPHTQCVHRASILAIRSTRLASTASPQKDSSKPLLPTSSATQVPLHVGLDRNPDAVSAISRIPIPKGEKNERFTPSTLTRPLGVRTPPLPGQNTPFDRRSPLRTQNRLPRPRQSHRASPSLPPLVPPSLLPGMVTTTISQWKDVCVE